MDFSLFKNFRNTEPQKPKYIKSIGDRDARVLIFLPFNKIWMYYLSCLVFLQCVEIIFQVFIAHNEEEITRLFGSKFLIAIIDISFLVDTILTILHRLLISIRARRIYLPRPQLLIAIDVLTLIKPSTIYYYVSGESINKKVYYTLRSVKFLRLYHILLPIVGFEVKKFNAFTYCLDYFLITSLFIHIFTSLWYYSITEKFGVHDWTYHISDKAIRFAHKYYEWYVTCMYFTTQVLSTTGVGDIVPVTLGEKWTEVLFGLCGFALTTTLIVTTTNFVTKTHIHEYIFSNELSNLKLYFERNDMPHDLRERTVEYYEALHFNRHGTKHPKSFDLLPIACKMEVTLDIFWDAFQHSHFFCNMDLPVLRALSVVICSDFYMPGDKVFTQNMPKDKMVYIVSGIVQVCSSQDDESPIISLSSGTCIGEVSLFASYPSKTDVKCSTYCECFILLKRDFINVMLKFPQQRQEIFAKYKKMFMRAGQLQNEFKVLQEEVSTFENASTFYYMNPIKWLKVSLKTWRSKEEPVVKSKGKSFAEVHTNTLYIHCTSAYLNKCALPEELALKTDVICLSDSFPWILQPDTKFLMLWDVVVLTVVLLISFTYPYYATFQRYTPRHALEWTVLVDIVFFLDIYISLTTAIRTTGELVINFKRILRYRLKEPGFILDVLAFLPIEIFMPYMTTPNVRYLPVFRMNRLIKIWKVYNFFLMAEKKLVDWLLLLKTIKLVLLYALSMYWCANLVYYVACFDEICNPDSWYTKIANEELENGLTSHENYFSLSLFYSSQFITNNEGCGIYPRSFIDVFIATSVMFLSWLMFCYSSAQITALQILIRSDTGKFNDSVKDIMTFLKARNLSNLIIWKVSRYLETQWYDNKGRKLFFAKPVIELISPTLQGEVFNAIVVATLRELPIFWNCSQEFMLKVAATVKRHVLPPCAVISYAGFSSEYMVILDKGYVKVTAGLSEKQQIVGPIASYNIVESLLGIAQVNTVMTITHCDILMINVKDFQKLIRSNQDLEDSINKAIKCITEYPDTRAVNDQNLVTAEETIDMRSDPSFINMGYNLRRYSVKWNNYFNTFKRMGKFSIFGNLLLRICIVPTGSFMLYWECSRAVFAIFSAMLSTTIYCLETAYPSLHVVVRILDFLALADIYVRFHVGYYNEKGILVRHPMSTAYYYLTHAFVIDHVASFPYEMLAPSWKSKTIPNLVNAPASILRLNRILQTYRSIGTMDYLIRNIPVSFHFVSMVQYLPFFLIGTNAMSELLVLSSCDLGGENGTEIVVCNNMSLFREFSNETENHFHLHFHGVYFVLLSIFRQGYGEFQALTKFDLKIYTLLSFVGILLMLVLCAKSASIGAVSKRNLKMYQEKMKHIILFMFRAKVPPDTQREVINNFELMWNLKRGINMKRIFSTFYPSLKEDLMFALYGTYLREISIFSGQNIGVFYAMADIIDEEVAFVRNAEIIKLNSLCSRMYMVLKGSVVIKYADDESTCTLSKGGIFGNIDNCHEKRMPISVIANDDVVVAIYFSTQEMYSLLQHYPQLLERFEAICHQYLDYIPPISKAVFVGVAGNVTNFEENTTFESRFLETIERIKRPFQTKTGKYIYKVLYGKWDFMICVVVSHVSICLQTFSTVVSKSSLPSIDGILFCFDVLYFIKIFFGFFQSFEDEHGNTVTDRRLTSKRYLKRPLGFTVDLLSSFPYELLNYLVPGYKYSIYSRVLKTFVCLRGLIIIEYFERKFKKLHINVHLLRISETFILLTLMIHGVSCVWIVFTCPNSVCITNGERQPTLSEAFFVYSSSVYVITNVFLKIGLADTNTDDFNHKIVILIATYVSTFSLVAVITQFHGFFEGKNIRKSEYELEAFELMNYLAQHQMTPLLQDKVWYYLCALWLKNRGANYPIMLTEPPDYVAHTLNYGSFAQTLRKNPLFCDIHEDFVFLLTTKIAVCRYFHENFLAFQGDITRMTFFIFHGQVEEITTDDTDQERVRNVLTDDDIIGILEGVEETKPYSYTYKAVIETVVITLCRDDWWYMLEYFPSVQERIEKNMKLLLENTEP